MTTHRHQRSSAAATQSTVRLPGTMPGPNPLPIIGPAGHTMRLVVDSIAYARRLFARFGPVVALSRGGGTRLLSPLPHCPGTVLAYGPDKVRAATTQHEVFSKQPISGSLYPLGQTSERTAPLRHFLTGLFVVNSDAHRQQRRLLLPAFHKQQIAAYRDAMVAVADDVIGQWRPNQPRDVAKEMSVLAMRIATRTLFGADIGAQGLAVSAVVHEALGLLANPLTTRLVVDAPGLPYRRFLDLAARYDAAMRAIIAQKRAAAGSSDDVLALLLAARDADSGATLSEDEVIGHAGVIFAAGHETSANALTWTLLLLSQHPRIAADVVDELDAVLHGAAPTIEHLTQLPLLERVVKESLRVLPPVPWNGRVTTQDTELGGHTLPAGTEVLISIYQTHHMPELYHHPERFDPRRWEHIDPPLWEYNPFSAGARMCLGASFAMLEIKLVLAMVLQRYRFELPRGTRVDRSGIVTIGPKGGLRMLIRAQDRQFARGVGGVRGNVREMVELP